MEKKYPDVSLPILSVADFVQAGSATTHQAPIRRVLAMGNFSPSKAALLTAAAVSLSLVEAAAQAGNERFEAPNPYVAGDMHNHNTCTDGSVAAGYSIHRARGQGT